jgi:hypothetical protein
MAESMRIEADNLARRIAARILGDYPPPRLRHAEELLAELERAAAREVAAGEWNRLAAEIAGALRASGVDQFLRLPPIAKTMHPRIRGRSRGYLRHVLGSDRFSPEFQRALTESPVGKPLVNPHYPLSSPLLVQHAYHLIRLLEATQLDLAGLRLVVDFGGGYGGFCRLLRNICYREKYLIWDLPVMCALQRFYLRNVFPGTADGAAPANIEWLTGADPGARDVLMRHVAEREPSLFVATWSLSETPPTVREQIVPALEGCGYVLLAYQRAFGETDNVAWFGSLEKRLPQFRWQHFECPVYRNNFYLIGRNAARA